MYNWGKWATQANQCFCCGERLPQWGPHKHHSEDHLVDKKFSEVKKMLFTGVRNKPPELGGGIRSYMNRDQMSPGTSTLVKAMPGPLVELYLSKPTS